MSSSSRVEETQVQPAPRDEVRKFSGASLRAKFMLAMVLVTSGLTIGALVIVRARVTQHIQDQVRRDLTNSSEYLRSYEGRRAELVDRMAKLVADTPLLKALLTTHDAVTIQDGTKSIAAVSGAQLFVATDPSGKILAVHGSKEPARATVEKALQASIQAGRQRDWWLVDGRLYDVVLTPVSAGAGTETLDVGVLACGFEIDPNLVREIASLTDADVVVRYKDAILLSTLPSGADNGEVRKDHTTGVHDTRIGNERFLLTEVFFGQDASSPVLVLLKSYDRATAFLTVLNWIVISIGILAVLAGLGLAYLISNRFTMPLRELLTGVQALQDGKYDYPLLVRGHDEAAQLTDAFARMRSALEKSQEQLLRSTRMEALGRLAGGVAHDFNNIITIISGYGELALDKSTADPQLTSFIQEIRKAGERATGLTRQLLAFSRKQVLQPQPLDLNAILANINKMLRVLVGEDVQLVIAQGAALPTVMADPGQIEQVIMNLAANSRDAMPGGGTLSIATTADYSATLAGTSEKADRYVVLAITDTGTGMSPETIKHIFEPFFTTKAPGKGTGLGLATVYGIVQQSGGFLEVQSELGKGTTFRVCLPAVETKPKAIVESTAVSPQRRASGVILVVEDEEPVRRLAIAGLQECGYTVLAATNGREALAVIAAQNRPVDLIVSDVIMPEMGGRELFDALKHDYPAVKVLFMSGYSDRSLAELGDELEASLLPKPFTPHLLAQKVAAVLEAREPAAEVKIS